MVHSQGTVDGASLKSSRASVSVRPCHQTKSCFLGGRLASMAAASACPASFWSRLLVIENVSLAELLRPAKPSSLTTGGVVGRARHLVLGTGCQCAPAKVDWHLYTGAVSGDRALASNRRLHFSATALTCALSFGSLAIFTAIRRAKAGCPLDAAHTVKPPATCG